jgi:16S rRNA G527 N7-methylase RsmG
VIIIDSSLVVQQVSRFVHFLLSENEKYNLTAVRTKEEAYVRFVGLILRLHGLLWGSHFKVFCSVEDVHHLRVAF